MSVPSITHVRNSRQDDKTILKVLKQVNQTHILRFLGVLSDEAHNLYLEKLMSINFVKVMENYNKARDFQNSFEYYDNISPPTKNIVDASLIKTELEVKWKKIGLKNIAAGAVGLILLGDRVISSQGAIGTINPNLISEKSIFTLHAERIQKIYELATGTKGNKIKIPWYIIVNENNQSAIMQHFADHKYWGLEKSYVFFIKEETFPCFDNKGKIVLRGKNDVITYPGGTGGMLSALKYNNVLTTMKKQKLVYLFIYDALNLCIKILDPIFVGYSIEHDCKLVCKSIRGDNARHYNSIFCERDGKTLILPHRFIRVEKLEEVNDRGNLVLELMDICNYLVSFSFLQNIVNSYSDTMQYCLIEHKSINDSAIDVIINPSGHNIFSLQRYLEQMLNTADNMIIWEVDRLQYGLLYISEADGQVMTQHALYAIYDLHRTWIQEAGGIIASDVNIEISPLVSYDGEGLEFVNGACFKKCISLEAEDSDEEISIDTKAAKKVTPKSDRRVSTVNFLNPSHDNTDNLLQSLYAQAMANNSKNETPDVFRFDASSEQVLQFNREESLQMEMKGVEEFREILRSKTPKLVTILSEDKVSSDNISEITTTRQLSISTIQSNTSASNRSKTKIKPNRTDEMSIGSAGPANRKKSIPKIKDVTENTEMSIGSAGPANRKKSIPKIKDVTENTEMSIGSAGPANRKKSIPKIKEVTENTENSTADLKELKQKKASKENIKSVSKKSLRSNVSLNKKKSK